MADFNKVLAHILELEGGYANVSGDRGGETYCGISRVAWPNWQGWAYVDARQLNLPDLKRLVEKFYADEFWTPMRCGELDTPLAMELMDIGVNSGIGTAVKLLQRLLNVCNREGSLWPDLPVTGNFLTMTMQAVQAFSVKYGQEKLARLLNGMQMSHYVRILEASPGQEKFAWGWLDRRVLA